MDYYSAYAGDYGMPDMSNTPGDPNAGAPGYHWDATQQAWVPDAASPATVTGPGGIAFTPQTPQDPTAAAALSTALTNATPTGVTQPGGAHVLGYGGAGDTGGGDTNPSGPGALAPFSEAAPTIAQQPAFSFDQFKPPTMEEALNDPGAKARWQRGMDSLQGWAAARGTINDSDTAKMLIDYGQNSEEQDYGNVYARDFGTWQGNEQAAERTYGLNRQTQYVDPYTAAYNAWVQRGNFYLNNQGTTAQSALGFASL